MEVSLLVTHDKLIRTLSNVQSCSKKQKWSFTSFLMNFLGRFLCLLTTLIAAHVQAQVLPSSLFFSGAVSVNGSSVTGQCSNVRGSAGGIMCTNPVSSVLSDGNIPTLTSLDGNMWATQLLTLTPVLFDEQLDEATRLLLRSRILTSAIVIANFNGIPDYIGLSRVEIMMFNCPDWGIMADDVVFIDSSHSPQSFNPAMTSCNSIVKTCVEQFTNDTLVALQFVFTPGSNYTHIAEITFFNDSDDCSPSAVTSDPLTGVYIGVGAVAALVLGVLFFILCYKLRKQKIKIANFKCACENGDITPHTAVVNDHPVVLTNFQMLQTSREVNHLSHYTIPSRLLTIGKILGQGEYGVVYKGTFQRGISKETVAVKTLGGFVQRELVTSLLKECVSMSWFDHPNVLNLIGVCLDGGPAPYIVMPFMENGSLLSYLRKEKDTLVSGPDNSMQDADPLTRKLLGICIQVAKGMEYLASKGVIHRDLAARNCMIDYHFVIKVADFGLSETIGSSRQYYRQDEGVIVKLPIKWLAPESINESVFSEKTDIWSYGVTCWEVFSGGKTPYAGTHHVDLPNYLDAGHRMEKPVNDACSEEVYSIIKTCWKAQPQERPTFTELVIDYSTMLGNMAGYTKACNRDSQCGY